MMTTRRSLCESASRSTALPTASRGGWHITHHIYDLAGRLTSVTYAYGTWDASTVSYAYDNDGRKLSETDSLGHATNYTYDAAGNLLSVSGVKGNFTYTYDNARNRISMTDGDNNKTTYIYDARKRLQETDYPDSTRKTNGRWPSQEWRRDARSRGSPCCALFIAHFAMSGRYGTKMGSCQGD